MRVPARRTDGSRVKQQPTLGHSHWDYVDALDGGPSLLNGVSDFCFADNQCFTFRIPMDQQDVARKKLHRLDQPLDKGATVDAIGKPHNEGSIPAIHVENRLDDRHEHSVGTAVGNERYLKDRFDRHLTHFD